MKVQKNQDLTPWLWLALTPALWMLGLVFAQVPYLLWPDYSQPGRVEPKWFGLLCNVVLLLTVQIGGLIALHLSRRNASRTASLGMAPVAVSIALLLINGTAVLLNLAARWASQP